MLLCIYLINVTVMAELILEEPFKDLDIPTPEPFTAQPGDSQGRPARKRRRTAFDYPQEEVN